VTKRSPPLPLLRFLFGDPGGPAAKKLSRGHLSKAIDLLDADLYRRMRECDEREGLFAAELSVLILRMKRAIRLGDAEAAALWALKLGVTIQPFEHTFNYGAALERGEKFDDALQRAAESKANTNPHND
jgi:hypothetical protein